MQKRCNRQAFIDGKAKPFAVALFSVFTVLTLYSNDGSTQTFTRSQLDYQRLWRYCPSEFIPPSLDYQPRFKPIPQPLEELETNITADKAVVTEMEVFELSGDVQVIKGNVVVHAEEMEYQRSRDILTAQGALRLEADNVLILGDSARISLSGSGEADDLNTALPDSSQPNSSLSNAQIENAQIWLPLNHLRGEATQVRLTADQRMYLTDASVTSCMLGNNDWLIKASELRLDKQKNEAVAKHARLKVFHVPILYSPYLSFPIAGRKSGLLAPDIGTSNMSGTEVAVPYYWNIAPHRDATITPR